MLSPKEINDYKVPANSGISHYNFKGTYSIVALIVVDTCYRITLVDCGGQGRISDSGPFRTSSVNTFLEAYWEKFPRPAPLGNQGIVDSYILADVAFGQTGWIQGSFMQIEAKADERKSHFNKCFSSYA
ncbi:hypothetical protein Aduo_019077 [Ancylostoma duodenale]